MQELCPISNEKINENVVRITAGFVFLFTALGFAITKWLMIVLVIDFFIRGFVSARYSLLIKTSKIFTEIFKLGYKEIEAAPKFFASKLGFLMSTTILIFEILELSIPSLILYITLLLCSLLESAFGYCVGCKIYTLKHLIWNKR